ncbi:siderophore ABC transporter substrate-binding protein [Clostridium sp. OS1-26]|uniref:siderophore ABC transporter substrate-binding protein n=1 Tax=Clostridium sp. OS1-26 TaxID=3070681 RepID=UPI0027E139E8|nr:siderophore ABC transporter substrate-binding protein [Clostridium sp. OS1-26]WML32750.1 siderophore ABC transporter substrate-binding protein [Clostridium sp. OS1-26]
MKRNKKIILSISIILIAIIVGFGYSKFNAAKNQSKTEVGENITIKHELGEVNIKKNPKKIVVFDYGIVDSIDKMGIDITALPKSNIPNYLKKFKDEKYIDAGTLFEPNFEKIQELKPDLIVISPRQASVYNKLNEIAPTVYLNIVPTDYVNSFKSNMETLGKIFNKEDFVKEELAKIDTSIKLLNKKVTQKNQKALIMMANEGNLSAFGDNSRFGIIHTNFGFPKVDENIKESQHGMNISYEYLAEKSPDYLFVIDRSAVTGKGDSAQKTLDNDIVKGTSAYKNNRIIYLDPQIWYVSSGGFVGTNAMIDEIMKAIEK